MKRTLLNYLACPVCTGAIKLSTVSAEEGIEVLAGELQCAACDKTFLIVRGIPRFANLANIRGPVLVVNGAHDEMIPVVNSYWLSENLPNAVLLIYPDAGHGALFQFHESFTRQAAAFLASDSPVAPY